MYTEFLFFPLYFTTISGWIASEQQTQNKEAHTQRENTKSLLAGELNKSAVWKSKESRKRVIGRVLLSSSLQREEHFFLSLSLVSIQSRSFSPTLTSFARRERLRLGRKPAKRVYSRARARRVEEHRSSIAANGRKAARE